MNDPVIDAGEQLGKMLAKMLAKRGWTPDRILGLLNQPKELERMLRAVGAEATGPPTVVSVPT